MREADELWSRALEPPMSLIEYRLVAAGEPSRGRGMDLLYEVWRTNPGQFRREWREEEKAYRLALAALGKARPEAPEPGAAPDESPAEDAGSDRVEELIVELMDRAKVR